MIATDDKHLLMIEPQHEVSAEAVQDWATAKMAVLLASAKNGTAYLGMHTCTCGKRSGTCDLVLPDGTVTNSLALHYLERHRDEVPQAELAKLRKMPLNARE